MQPGPFLPCAGGLPPCLAGRERERTEIDDFLEAIRSGVPPPSMLILYGPRGNGKTTLLNWTSRQALDRRQALDQGIRSLRLDASEILTEDTPAKSQLPDAWLTRIFHGVSWRGTEVRLRRPEASSVTKALARLAKKSPTVFLIDEAHTLETTLGAQLLQAAQILAGDGKPFLLALAGAPDLPGRLRKMRVTFWERSAICPLRRLDDRAASDAIRIPFERAGHGIAPEALESIVRDSHGYPYFLQVWGSVLWSQVRRPSGRLEWKR